MAYLGLVLFCLACFAGDVVELDPVGATGISSNANVSCSAITTATTNYQTECNSLPGCTWKEDVYTGGDICQLDECWQYGTDSQASNNSPTPAYPCVCSSSGLWTEQDTASCTNWETSGFPPHTAGSGTGKDFYCRRSTLGSLDECSFPYLKNGSCTAPFCILVDHSTSGAGKVCKKIPECAVSKLSDPPNAIRLNNNSIADCLTARYKLGETTACNQNPRFYLSGSSCVEDPLYEKAADQDNPVCTGGVVKQVNGINAGASVTLSYCASADNPVLNTCWHLTNVTVPGNAPPNQCPINPNPNGTLLTENTNLCTGDCFLQTFSSYYYGYTKICVNAESAGGGSSILVVPSLIALLLLALFL